MSFFRTMRSADRFAADNAGEILLEKFDYDDDGKLIYQGAANNVKATDSDEIWALVKFTYNGDGKLISTEYRYLVAWNERALQDWS